jgi:hypothetical protein
MLKQVIYIAGYGRSGSTLLELILHANGAESIGEFTWLSSNIDKSKNCTCGKDFYHCDFWGKILDNDTLDIGDYLKVQKKIDTPFGRFYRNEKINRIEKQIYHLIFQQAGSDHVSESSKTGYFSMRRPFNLIRNADLEVKMIHIYRNPKDVMMSNLSGSNRKLEIGLKAKKKFSVIRTCVQWNIANIMALSFRKRYPDNYFILSYENMMKDRKGSLQRLTGFLDFPVSMDTDILSNSNNHMVDGNRLRLQTTIQINENIGQKTYNKSVDILYFLCGWLYDKLRQVEKNQG